MSISKIFKACIFIFAALIFIPPAFILAAFILIPAAFIFISAAFIIWIIARLKVGNNSEIEKKSFVYYLYSKDKSIEQKQQKATPTSIFLNLLARKKLLDIFNLYQLTSSEKDAEDLIKEGVGIFLVDSWPPIHAKIEKIKPSENRENYKINSDEKIPIFLWRGIENSALEHLKNNILLPNKKPGVIVSFCQDNQDFWKRSGKEHNLLLIKTNLDFKHNNYEENLGLIIEEIMNWQRKKLQGLPNIGNTCYMNSLIQVFSIMPRFDQVLQSINSPIFSPLAQIISALKMRNKNFDYKYYLQDFQKEIIKNFNMFTAHAQHDTKELYNVLIDEIVSKKEENIRIFTTITNKCFSCKEEHKPAFKEESQLFLVIPGNSFGNVEDHIKKEHYFNGNNKLWCEICQEMRDTKLTVEHVEWPSNLAIYISGNGLASNLKYQISLDNQDYNLYAIICHSGNNSFGHYWAHLLIDEKWIECNDSFVHENPPKLSNCYMLFYSKELIK